jgi:phospholipid/cholesterol/gamma-HCH transport system substrate-binding protein
MARHSEASLMRMGAISLAVLLVVMAAAFNLQKFPGFRGTNYHADFTDASGLAKGSMVQVAGIRVGRVDALKIEGNKVRVDFDVHGVSFGPASTASVEVLNLLGEKFLNLTPKGSGQLPSGGTIPLGHTSASYDIVSTLNELTTTTEKINTTQLANALTTLAGTINSASPEVESSFTGLSRLSRTIASRDSSIQDLLSHADHVTKLLADRKGDLVTLMKQAKLIFNELQQRRQAIHSLLVNANTLAVTLRGVATDNQKTIGKALADLHDATVFLRKRDNLLQETLHNLAPYAQVLINVVATGPWFDAYVPNLVGLATGEFVPGSR